MWLASHVSMILSIHNHLGASPVSSSSILKNSTCTAFHNNPFYSTAMTAAFAARTNRIFGSSSVFLHSHHMVLVDARHINSHIVKDLGSLLPTSPSSWQQSKAFMPPIGVSACAFQVISPSFHASYHQFYCLHSATAFHHWTWRTIVNVRLHNIYEVKLNNLIPANRATNIKFDQKLTFRVVNNHVTGLIFASPHIKHRLNISLSFACPSYRQNPQILPLNFVTIHSIHKT